ncbi:hypothetical protein [Streptomyces sp. PvR018]|uniref:hypothetical protein n=1 Tax=Streptomyces TaxID=1883 RepID=UPI000B9F8FD3|nr:hypothetical protein BEH93_18265 [Streptomyces sp. 2R]
MTTPPNPGTGSPPSDPRLPGERPLVSLRAAVIFLIGFFFGLIAGGLTHLDGHSTAMAVLAGLGAVGVSIPVLHVMIGGH